MVGVDREVVVGVDIVVEVGVDALREDDNSDDDVDEVLQTKRKIIFSHYYIWGLSTKH